MTNDFLFDIVDHYMSEGTQKKVSARIKAAEAGSTIFSTYASHQLQREVFSSLCKKCGIKVEEKISENYVYFIKIE